MSGAKKNILKKYLIIGGLIIATIAIIGGVFYFGYSFGFKKGTEKPQTLIIRGVSNIENGQIIKDVDFNLFWESWKILKDKFVDAGKIDDQTLVYGAISGLLNSLKDPHTIFMPPTDAKKFNEDISGEFSGIGAEIGIRNDQLVVISPLKNTPAERAGLKAGDKILKIDDKNAINLSVDEAVKLIRGLKQTKVVLTILRNNWEKAQEIPIIRDIIQIPTLDWEMKDENISYLRLYNFYENAPFLFYQSAIKTALDNPKGLIIDLRNNPGGYLEVAVNLAGWFLNSGDIIVSEEFHSGEKDEFKANGNGFFKDIPMVILINEGSASASEILAGALRDNRNIKIIGKKSFGKGTVQELQQLKGGSSIKITVAHWLMPNGGLIDKNGIIPDYDINITEEDIKNDKDPQLEKAIEILKTLINK